MKILLHFTSLLLVVFVLLPTASMAETEDSARSTSLGTGLPTSEDKYERPELTPEPTKPPTTDYEFVEEEEDSSDEDSLLEDDYAFDEDYLEEENYSDNSTITDGTVADAEETPSQNDNTNTSTNENIPTASSNSESETSTPSTTNDLAQQEMTELPPTGVTNNYWGLIGTIVIIVAVLIFFFFRKRNN